MNDKKVEAEEEEAPKAAPELYPGQHGGFKDGVPRELAEMPDEVRATAEATGATIQGAYEAQAEADKVAAAQEKSTTDEKPKK